MWPTSPKYLLCDPLKKLADPYCRTLDNLRLAMIKFLTNSSCSSVQNNSNGGGVERLHHTCSFHYYCGLGLPHIAPFLKCSSQEEMKNILGMQHPEVGRDWLG